MPTFLMSRQTLHCIMVPHSSVEGKLFTAQCHLKALQVPGFCEAPDVHCNYDYGHSLGRGEWRYRVLFLLAFRLRLSASPFVVIYCLKIVTYFFQYQTIYYVNIFCNFHPQNTLKQ